jgi:acylpyruvate hydrolase
VIGQRCKNVPASRALSVVGGYMALNDVSARDLQLQTPQWTAGKAIDGFAPCGPWLATADEIEDPQALELTTRVNGKVVQHASTSEMIFSISQTIEFITKLITLEVGDIIATGTPAGVGAKRNPPQFLASGDEVEVAISGLGVLRNPVIDEQQTISFASGTPEGDKAIA